MKLIFDFDDVIFFNTLKIKEGMYSCLEKVGVPRSITEEYYKETREKQFSLKNYLKELIVCQKIEGVSSEDVYEDIMKDCANFTNKEILEIVKNAGKESCYIITNGDEEFQFDKIKRAGVVDLFCEVIIVSGSKKEAIERICREFNDEKIIFIDDRSKFIDDLDLESLKNLKTVLFDENGLKKLEDEIKKDIK